MKGGAAMEFSTIREVQEAQLDIFKQFLRICDKHGLAYFIVFGTLLGAVQFKGFIPWDDDIDVAMKRNDFEEFLTIAERELPKPYFIQTHKTDPEYFHHIARVQNLDTTSVERRYKHLNIKCGICIDVYPLDGVVNTWAYNTKVKLMDSVYRRCINEWIDNSNCWETRFKTRLGKVISTLVFSCRDRDFYFDKIEKLYRNIPYDDVQDYVASFHDSNIFPKKFFEDTAILEFEGMKVIGPAHYDEFFKRIYGDYTMLPPESERKRHHGYEALNVKIPYAEYLSQQEQQ